ncbi:Von Willebrand factor type [Elusimicrobium minutum Pei191]|uniref:von Willebrand factor type n=1 Tax=Elusimicrobium minutum (strain Pei191) TaxID=445932 RepID=B2KDS8_ELUMP|nr:VWA domain-containing protein [Elusimicrobium minutum]ACC98674.1 Von Willebrand factor type [Elusimicrobium minutum Pei191]
MSLFRNPFVLLLMPLCIFLIVGFWHLGNKRKKRFLNQVFSENILSKIKLPFSKNAALLKDVLLFAGLIFIFIALAGPQWGVEKINVTAQSSHSVIAVDVSDSMKARDLKPTRLENAKTMLKMLISAKGEQRTGIVAFTSKAYTQCPITNDVEALKYFVNQLRPEMLNAKGTALAPAVQRAAEMLSKYPGKKALILLTDGEDHEPEQIEEAIKTAQKEGIKIIAVGIGTEEGEPIPEKIEGGRVLEYKKDADGKTVITKLDEKSLKELASKTGGVYIKYKNAQTVAAQIAQVLEDLDKNTRDINVSSGFKNRYQIPLALGILLVFASLIIPLKKVR